MTRGFEVLAGLAALFVMFLVAVVVIATVVHLLAFLLCQIPSTSQLFPGLDTMLPPLLKTEAGGAAGRDDTLPRLLHAMLMVLVGWAFGVLLAFVLKNQTDFKDTSATAYVTTAALVVGTLAGFILIPIVQQYRNEKYRLSLVGCWQRVDGGATSLRINRWHVVIEGRPDNETYPFEVRRHRMILQAGQRPHELSYELLNSDELLLHSPEEDSVTRRLAGRYRRVGEVEGGTRRRGDGDLEKNRGMNERERSSFFGSSAPFRDQLPAYQLPWQTDLSSTTGASISTVTRRRGHERESRGATGA